MLNRLFGKYSHMALAMTAGALLVGPAVNPAVAQIDSAQSASPTSVANRPTGNSAANYQTLYVNPEVGNDSANGVEAQPLRTVTRALEVAPPNTVIVLAPGRYTQQTGEVFPLQLKPGVTIQGTPGSNDRTAIIEGGGDFTSPTRSQQNAAIIAADRAGIAQIAVSNPDGYGVWIESASPTILESAFVGNRQTGIYVAGGSPRVQGSYFSGNQVAGLIVFGVSNASIQRNIFDGTGDAIRILEGATPEIIGNRITNNEAGLVLIGDAQPVIRDNQIVGNRRNDVVEVAARTRDISASVALEDAEEEAKEPELAEPEIVEAEDTVVEVAVVDPVSNVSERAANLTVSSPLIATQPLTEPIPVEPTAEPTAEDEVSVPVAETTAPGEIPAGAPGSALQALQAGLALGPRAVTGENPDSSSLIRNRRPSPATSPEPAIQSAPPVNSNRLAVPNTSIPIGSGSSSTIFSPPNGGGSSPPAPPSRAQALGLYYRVFVEASDPFVQDNVREVVPDAFRTRFEGRTVMQVGAFPTEGEAEDRRRLLEDNNFNVRVEYIR